MILLLLLSPLLLPLGLLLLLSPELLLPLLFLLLLLGLLLLLSPELHLPLLFLLLLLGLLLLPLFSVLLLLFLRVGQYARSHQQRRDDYSRQHRSIPDSNGPRPQGFR